MTITVAPARNEYTSNAAQTIFNYTFKIFSISDLNVYITPAGQDANDSTDLTTAYTVTNVGDEDGGTITLSVGANLNDLVTIASNVPSSRTTDYQNNGDFNPSTVNDDFDRVVSIAKKVEGTAGRTLVFQESQQNAAELTLPAPKAGLAVRWDSAESGLENYDPSTVSNEEIANDKVTISYNALSSAVNDASLKVNQACNIAGRVNVFDGGGAMWDSVFASSVTINTFNIVQCVGAPDLALVLRIKNNIYNVAQFGAIDGAADNTDAMRQTMESAAATSGTYYLPSGLWVHGQIDWRINVNGRGDGETSIDERLSDPTNPTTTKVSYRFFNSDTVPPFNRALNIRNIDITGIEFRGTTVTDGFSEQKHLLMIQGGTDIKIHGCWFKGWQGDAIVIRSGNFTAAAQNENIRIFNNQFNGVNKNNRNAITFNDCSGLWIMFNNFLNCTRDGDVAWVNPSPYDSMDQASGPAMPGAIDCEPNIGDTFVVLKNINILYNTFANIGGNVAAIAFFLPTEEGAYTNGDPQNINIVGNTGDVVYKGLHLAQDQNADVTDASFNSNYKVTLNHFKNTSNSPFWYYGIKGIDAYENTWEDCALQGYIGWLIGLPNRGCNSIKVSDTFKHVGGGVALTIYNSDRIDLLENTFDNCGAPGGGFGIPIDIGTGVSSRIRINRNTYINNEGLMTSAVSTSGTLTPGNNELIGNDFAGLSAGFLAETTDSGENTVDNSVIATAGGQATATQLSNAMNIVVTAAAFDSIKLPTSEGTARQISISNRAGVTIQIYPFSGDNLGNGTNSPISLVTGGSLSFKSFSINDWMIIS